MGLRGPSPKPTSIKIAEGNPGKKALNLEEPQFMEGEPSMPHGISAGAKRVWREIVPELLACPGLLTKIDGYALWDLCEVIDRKLTVLQVIEDRRRQILEQLKLDAVTDKLTVSKKDIAVRAKGLSMTMSTPSGYVQQHPDVGMLNTLQEQENRLRQQFGMSPASRSSLRIPGGKAQEADSVDSLYSGRPVLVRNA